MMRAFLIATLLVPGFLGAQEAVFRWNVEPEQILIGDWATVTLELRSHASDSVAFPVIGDTLVGEVEVLERSQLDTTFEGPNLEERVLSQRLTVTAFDSGYFAIPPRVARVNGDSLVSNPILLTVKTVEVDTTKDIFDIRAIQEVPFSLEEWLKENWKWFAYAIPAAMLLGLLTWFIWLKTRKQREETAPVVPPRAAHLVALEKLDELVREKRAQGEDVKGFYSELTLIMRTYIEQRYLVPALEQTTGEINASLKRKADLPKEHREHLRQLLLLADLVKFAKERPLASENEMHLKLAREFVLATKKEAAPADEFGDEDEETEDRHG